MAPKKNKKKAEAASPSAGQEKLGPDQLFRLFHSEYKKRCDEAQIPALALVTKNIDSPAKLDWLLLNKERLRPAQLTAIIGAARQLQPDVLGVRHFTVWHCGLGDVAATEASRLLPDRFRLTKLDLFEEGVSAVGAAALGAALAANTTLKELQLNYNPLGDAGVEALSRGMQGNTTLEVLHLAFCDCGLEGAMALSTHVLANPQCGLKQLCLRGNSRMGVLGVRAVLEAVQMIQALSHLDISETFKQNHDPTNQNPVVGLGGVLRRALAGHPSLTAVDLRGNHIDEDDATTLLALVETNSMLGELQVDRNLGPEVYEQLTTKTAENKSRQSKGGKKKGKSGKKKK